MAGHWQSLEAFAKVCEEVGSFGYGAGWDDKVGEFLELVPLDALLGHLEAASAEGNVARVDMLSLVLKHVFSSPRATRSVAQAKFVPTLVRGLEHFSKEVRLLTARQLRRIGVEAFEPAQRGDLLGALSAALADEDTGVAMHASMALVAFGRSAEGAGGAEVVRALRAPAFTGPAVADAGTTQVRIFTVAARLCAGSEAALKAAVECGLVGDLLKVFDSDDVLLQLNTVRLIPLVGATAGGLQQLIDARVIDAMTARAGLGGEESDPFLGEEALRVMAQLSARTLGRSGARLDEQFLDALQARLTEGAGSSAEARIGTLELAGAFAGAQPPASLEAVLDGRDEGFLRDWMALACGAGERVKTAGLHSIATALRGGAQLRSEPPSPFHQSADDVEFSQLLEQSMVEPTETERAKASQLGKVVFVAYGRALNEQVRTLPRDPVSAADVVEVLAGLASQPMDGLRCAVFALLRVVAAQAGEWGLQAIYSAQGVMANLLFNRSLELSKAAKEWRFSVLEAAFHSPLRDAVLGEKRQEELEAFLRRGPYAGAGATATLATAP